MLNKKMVLVSGLLLSTLFLSSCMDKDKNEEVKNDKIIDNVISEVMDDKMEGDKILETEKEGLYEKYSVEAVKNGNEKVVIFFHAEWCGVCVASEKDIAAKTIPSDMTILKANFDTDTELKKKYGVLTQTTFVQVDNEGNMIKKWVGGKLDRIIEETK